MTRKGWRPNKALQEEREASRRNVEHDSVHEEKWASHLTRHIKGVSLYKVVLVSDDNLFTGALHYTKRLRSVTLYKSILDFNANHIEFC